MTPASLTVSTALKIAKPVEQVFEAIVNPDHMQHYFIAESSGIMKTGETIMWKFPEMDLRFPIKVLQADAPKEIKFSWEVTDGLSTEVQIHLEEKGAGTFVKISEGHLENNEEGIKWLKDNTAGWANFLACLKAYLEYNINLRQDAFDPSQMPDKA